MQNAFADTLKDVHSPAPPELVKSLRERLEFIGVRYPHCERTVQWCQEGLAHTPSLLHVLVAAYVINGGVLLKHGPDLREQEDEEKDFEDLMRRIDDCANGLKESKLENAEQEAQGQQDTPNDTTSPK